MTKNVRRLALAAALSAAGFIATFTWYNATDTFGAGSSKSKPIARMVTTKNEVQRKLIQKLIWQPVNENEILHIGEAIRTAAGSEASIEFLGTSTRIDLDPDSAIILEESAGKIALNFLQGNLFVRGGESTASDGTTPGGTSGAQAAQAITLVSGDKKIAIGGAGTNKSEISLGKSKSGELDLQVLKGEAQIQTGDKTVTLEQGKALGQKTFKLLKPSSDEAIYIESGKSNLVTFKWAPLDASYVVTLEAGPTRNAMKLISDASGNPATGAGPAGELSAPVKLGRLFYRLVARSTVASQPEMSTLIYKNDVVAIVPPMPLDPEKDKKVVVNFESPQVRFAWSNPSSFEKVVFEIYKDAQLKQKMFSKVLSEKNELSLDIKSNGMFYWRVGGQLKNRGELVYSELQMFQTDVFKGLPTPKLDRPLAQEKLSAPASGEMKVALTWQPIAGATSYKVSLQKQSLVPDTVSSEKVQVLESEIPQVETEGLRAGSYSWSVQALDDTGRSSLASEKRTFEIVDLPLIEWAKDFQNSPYFSLKPTAQLKWLAPPVGIRSYRVRVTSSDAAGEPMNLFTQNLNLQVEVPTDGDYTAEVEALNAANQVIARSVAQKLTVEPAPLLPAPQFVSSLPLVLTASNSGRASLNWQKIDGAQKYVVILRSKDQAAPSRELAFTNASAELVNLMPGEYEVALKAIDQHGRVGPVGEARTLTVPQTSGVKAPKLKGVKVK